MPHRNASPSHSPARAVGPAPCICGRLRRATRALTRVYDEALDPSGLTVTQFTVLRALTALKTPTLAQLAASTAHEKSGLWRTLQPLIRAGAVTSGRVEGLRGARISLTPDGQARLALALPAWSAAQLKVSSVLGTRRNHMLALLSEIEALAPA